MKLFSQNWIKQADNKIKPMYADKSSDLVPIVNSSVHFCLAAVGENNPPHKSSNGGRC